MCDCLYVRAHTRALARACAYRLRVCACEHSYGVAFDALDNRACQAATHVVLSYVDIDGHPHTENVTSLPWSHTERTTLTVVSGSISVQVRGGHAGCRILVNDMVRDEKSESGQDADVICFPYRDVVYDPRPSALIRAWRAKGGLAIGGEEMLLWQAILQVILMTGADTADSSLMDVLEPAMRHALEEAL